MATISNDVDNTIISGTSEADSLGNGNSNVTIYGYEGNDTIYSINRVVSSGGSTTSVARDNVSIDAGAGDDYIRYHGGNYLSINAGDGNDTLSLHDGTYVSVDLGDGNDQLASFDEDNVTITAGSGKDRIDFSGNNVIINAGADDDEIVHYDGTSGVAYLVKTDPANLSYGSNITINAGTGNDTVLIGNNDVVSYSEGDGNDVIGGYYTNDTIQINSSSAPSTMASGNDIIINVGTGSIRLVNVTDTAVTAINASGDLINFSADTSTPVANETNTDSTIAPVNTESDTTSPVTAETDSSVIDVSNGKKLDIVFLIDNTSSMSSRISSVKSSISDFAQELKNNGLNCRYGLVEFGDIADSEIKTYEFTNDLDVFVSNVNDINLTSGGAFPESGLEAIMNGALTMNFDEDAEKRFIVVSDASFNNFGELGDGDSSEYLVTSDVSRELNDNAVTMDVIGSSLRDCRSEWEPIANATGGKFYLFDEGFPQIFKNIATDIINVVDLNLVPENQTGYFVATINSDTYTTPIFSTYGASGNDTTVGDVNEVNVYVADSDTSRQQTIIISDDWNATATKNDDKLLIAGVSATVTGDDGADVFYLGSDTRTVTLMDLNIDEDKLSFGNYITPGTMRQSVENNHLALSADNLRVDIPAMSEMTDEFLNYSVSNAGNSATISELINGDGRSIISFAHWSFSFTSSSLERFVV